MPLKAPLLSGATESLPELMEVLLFLASVIFILQLYFMNLMRTKKYHIPHDDSILKAINSLIAQGDEHQ